VRSCGAGTVTLRSFLATCNRPTTKALSVKGESIVSKFKDALDQKSNTHAEALTKIMEAYKEINDESTFEKSHYEIAEMIPHYVDRMNYCDSVIDLYKSNIEYLYEEYTHKDFSNKHRNIVAVSVIFSGFVAISGQLWLTLICGGGLYACLSRRELRKFIEGIGFHEWHLDSIFDLKSEVKKLEILRRS
jgi:hypothetical protein